MGLVWFNPWKELSRLQPNEKYITKQKKPDDKKKESNKKINQTWLEKYFGIDLGK